jgi:membrane associated rhomboid family serine protease
MAMGTDDATGSRPPPLPRRGRAVLIALAAFLAAIELLLQLGDAGFFGIPRFRGAAYEYFGFWPGILVGWTANYPLQPWTMFLTYAFLHGGLVHLGVNLLTLWSLGREVLDRVGPWGFIAIYTLSMLGGAVGFALLGHGFRPMVGASGALFGLAGAFLAWNYVDRFTHRLGLWPVARAVGLLIALNIVLFYAMDRLLAWETHLGGFIAGWIVAMLVDPLARQPEG